MTLAKTVWLALAALALASCATREPHVGTRVAIIPAPNDLPAASAPAEPSIAQALPDATGAAASTAHAPAPADAAAAQVPAAEQPRVEPPTPRLQHAQTIYFGPDAYKVDARYRAALEGHARRLKSSPRLRMVIQAYADTQGPSDYNLALSKKRADTVAKMLTSRGVSPAQLELVHRGEAAGQGGAAAQRRVELLYLGP